MNAMIEMDIDTDAVTVFKAKGVGGVDLDGVKKLTIYNYPADDGGAFAAVKANFHDPVALDPDGEEAPDTAEQWMPLPAGASVTLERASAAILSVQVKGVDDATKIGFGVTAA
jgi:hypothetical protein